MAVLQTLLKGVGVGPYDLCLLNGDNIGHVIKGEEAFYAQQTTFQEIIVRQLRLAELKIHHCEDPHERLQRDPTHDWIELCQNDMLEGDLAKDTGAANDGDFKTLSCVLLLEDMHPMIELEMSDCIRVDQEVPRAGYCIN